MPNRRRVSLGAVVGILFLGWGAVIAGTPLDDNSFFTHLSTGRLILHSGSVPSVDPYSFTAGGAPWTVQSWLPSVMYAAAERFGGDVGLRALELAIFMSAAGLVWRLSRDAESLLLRLAAAAIAMLVFTGTWSHRPYMIAFLLFSIVWLSLEGAVRPWLLVPVGWIWANAHGSYPLALLLVGATLVGELLDARAQGRPARPAVHRELKVLGFLVVGTVSGVLGPLGLEAVAFPARGLARSGAFAEIIEWQAPGFRTVSELAFLFLTLLTLVGIVRRGRWREAVPVLVFLVGALYAQRNIVFAALVLLTALSRSMPVVGALRGTSPVRPTVLAISVVLLGVLAAGVLRQPAVDTLDGYPAASVAWLAGRDALGERVVARDTAGNFLEVLYGTDVEIFIDDRADMFPPGVIDEFLALLRGEPAWSGVLDEYEANIVVWEREQPLTSLLVASDEWKIAFQDRRWAVACRRSSTCDLLTER